MSMGSIDLGRVGIWTGILDTVPSSRAAELTAEAEELGYGAIWFPEVVGRDPLMMAALVDAIAVWGTPEQITARVREHFDAGADHVGVQVLADGADATADGWRILAPGLLS